LGEDYSSSKIQTVSLDAEELQVLGRHKYQDTSDCRLKHFKGSVFLIAPEPGCVRLCKVKQRSGQCREVVDKLVVEIGKSQEGLYISPIFWGGPFLDSGDLDRVHRHFIL